uniref:Uncharacterized protein n=1 Tax=Oryza meridionalis TaxID=40149 RepID=A0A0E0EQT8_9ORYZ
MPLRHNFCQRPSTAVRRIGGDTPIVYSCTRMDSRWEQPGLCIFANHRPPALGGAALLADTRTRDGSGRKGKGRLMVGAARRKGEKWKAAWFIALDFSSAATRTDPSCYGGGRRRKLMAVTGEGVGKVGPEAAEGAVHLRD